MELLVTLPLGRRRRVDCVVLEGAVERGARDAKGRADRGDIRLAAYIERPGEFQLLGIPPHLRPATEAPASTRCRQASVRALPNQIALELRQRPKHMEDQLPICDAKKRSCCSVCADSSASHAPVSRRRAPRPTRLDTALVRGRVREDCSVHTIEPMSRSIWDRPSNRSPE
jgi:hypothetical protein